MKLTHTEQEVIDLNKDFWGKYEIENHPQVTVTDIIVDIIALVGLSVGTVLLAFILFG